MTVAAHWQKIYLAGAISAVCSLLLIACDVAVGISAGGDLTRLPQTAAAHFGQLRANPLWGLYNLDLLNAINQLVALPAYFALVSLARKRALGAVLIAFMLHLTGTILLVAGNQALAMLELSHKYAAAALASERALYAAAGESLLVQGAHGSGGMFFGFFLPNLAGVLLAVVVLRARILSSFAALGGLVGSILLAIYVALVTFMPSAKTVATALAMPGGLLLMLWMVLLTRKLFQAAFASEDMA